MEGFRIDLKTFLGKFGDFGPRLSPQNQLDIYFLTLWEYWLGLAKLHDPYSTTVLYDTERGCSLTS